MLHQNYTKRVKFNVSMHGRNAGDTETVKCDKRGTILNLLIRRRFKDNDGSVEIVTSVKENKTETKKSEKLRYQGELIHVYSK